MNFRKHILFTIGLVAFAINTSAQSADSKQDSTLKPSNLTSIEQVIINVNQTKTKGTNVNTLDEKQIQLINTGRDIPILLQTLPNVITTSDAGNGIGYTGIRVRGSDATRTNVTINGVPINDAESQGTFWVNMPDLASSASSITVQRGLGTSLSGSGAFGATVNVQTSENNSNEFQMSYGSYQSRKLTAKFSSPNYQIKPKQYLNFNGRISNITSNGFIDRAKSDLWSYFTSASYQSEKIAAKLLVFGGTEKTYQAWWGIPIEKFNLGKSHTSADSQALKDHYWRNAGVGYTYQTTDDSLNLFNSNPNTYNYYLYNNETDNYQQHHAHLYLNYKINQSQLINTTLYYTHGEGYFEQFRLSNQLSNYNLPNIISGDTGITLSISNSDLVRQRWLNNDLIGANINYVYSKTNQILTLGLAANQYFGQHFGYVTKVYAATESYNRANIPNTYYRATGNKTDLSFFAKYKQIVANNFSYFVDLQARKVIHIGKGTDNDLRIIDFEGNYSFFNPKAGFSYGLQQDLKEKFGIKHSLKHEFSGSVAAGSKEPSRSDFTDNKFRVVPKPEKMIDYELGYEFGIKKTNSNWKDAPNEEIFNLKINGYYMDYKDQLVLSGALNDVGTALRVNVAESYRIGIEIENKTLLFQKYFSQNKHPNYQSVTLLGNLALSRNRIKESPASWVDYFRGKMTFDTIYKNAPIAYSPDMVGSIGILYQVNLFKTIAEKEIGNKTITMRQNSGTIVVQYHVKTVGKQYLDNTGNDYRSLPQYQFSEFTLAYSKQLKNSQLQLKLQGNNITNQYFANNGYTWGYMFDRALIQEVFVFPTAMRNWNLSVGYIF